MIFSPSNNDGSQTIFICFHIIFIDQSVSKNSWIIETIKRVKVILFSNANKKYNQKICERKYVSAFNRDDVEGYWIKKMYFLSCLRGFICILVWCTCDGIRRFYGSDIFYNGTYFFSHVEIFLASPDLDKESDHKGRDATFLPFGNNLCHSNRLRSLDNH